MEARDRGTNPLPLVAPGVWLEARAAPRDARCAGLFLDRDGVIIEERGYLSSADDVGLLPGAARLIGRANRAGVPVVVVTNQSGIDRGIFGWAEFADVERRIARLLAADEAHVDTVVACPFHPDFTPGFGDAHARWRKPGPAMLIAAAEHLNLELASSWLVGDKAIDVGAARNAGLAGAIHVRTGHGRAEREAALALTRDDFCVVEEAGLDEAVQALDASLPGLAGSNP